MVGRPPSSEVEFLNGLNRYTLLLALLACGVNRSFDSAPNEFPTSLSDMDVFRDWGEGLAVWAAIFAAVGVLLVLILLIGYSISCCCLSQQSQDRKAMKRDPKNPETYNNKMFLFTMILSVLFLALAFGTFGPVTSLDDGFNRGIDGIENAGGTFEKFVDLTNGIVDDLDIARNTSRELATRAGNEDGGEDMEEALNGFADQIEGTQDIARTTSDLAQDIVDDLDPVIDDGRQISKDYAATIAFAYAGVMCATVIIFLITMIPKEICTCPFKVIGVPVNIFFLLVLWIVTGVVLAIALASADFCMAPNGNAIALVDDSIGGTVGNSLNFYLSCDPDAPDQPSPDDGVRYDVRRVLNETEKLVEETFPAKVEKLRQAVNESDNNQELQDILDEFEELEDTALKPALEKVRELDELAGCKEIQTTWDIFVKAYCGDVTTDGLFLLIIFQLIMGILLFGILCGGWSFCLRHPSRRHDKARVQAVEIDE